MHSHDRSTHAAGGGRTPAPIALFTYNRPVHTRRTIEALQDNALAPESELFIFSDGLRSAADRAAVEEVRDYLKGIGGFRRVSVIERGKNMGLAASIIAGVSEIVTRYGKIIVLEDDMVTSPFFLTYMNDALTLYEEEDRVISIHAYVYPVAERLPETFFLRGADCWGWSTWKRGWDLFDPDGAKLLDQLKKQRLQRLFDFSGTYPYMRMLKWQVKGTVDSWAIRWYASALLAGKLTLYPGRPLVSNIGHDASATHCVPTDSFDVQLSGDPIHVDRIPVEDHAGARQAFERYFRATRQSFVKRAARKLKRILSKGATCP